jgi:cytochrome c
MIINTILSNYHLIIINMCLSFESQVTQLSHSAAVDSQAWVRTFLKMSPAEENMCCFMRK